MSDPRETALKFVRQALDAGVTKEEGRTFAMKAVEFIDKHKLLEASDVTLKERAISFWRSVPLERIVAGVNAAGFAAAGYELIELKAENERLKERIRKLKMRLRRR